MRRLVLGECRDHYVATASNLVPLNKPPLMKPIEQGFHISVIVGKYLRLDSAWPIFQPTHPVSEAPKSLKQ
jgi:hypothetical protein